MRQERTYSDMGHAAMLRSVKHTGSDNAKKKAAFAAANMMTGLNRKTGEYRADLAIRRFSWDNEE